LLASVQITSYNSHSASFGPSAVGMNTAQSTRLVVRPTLL